MSLPVTPRIKARAADLEQLEASVLPLYLNPIPCRRTLRNWFKAAGVRKFKMNHTAKRGGGRVFYSVADVEKLFDRRTLVARGGVR